MGRWSEMESDDGEMSRRSGSSGGLRTETNLCLSHSALQSFPGPNPIRTANCHRKTSCLQWRTVMSDQSLLSHVSQPSIRDESAANG